MGQEVVFQDETGFSKVSYKRKTWSESTKDMVIDQLELNQPNITAVATVSAKRGLVYLKVQQESTDGDNFRVYLRNLSKKMEGKPFYLFLDNLSVHRMKVVK